MGQDGKEHCKIENEMNAEQINYTLTSYSCVSFSFHLLCTHVFISHTLGCVYSMPMSIRTPARRFVKPIFPVFDDQKRKQRTHAITHAETRERKHARTQKKRNARTHTRTQGARGKCKTCRMRVLDDVLCYISALILYCIEYCIQYCTTILYQYCIAYSTI